MNVLVYAAYALNTPHFETELEIMQRHIDANDTVYMVGCNADMLCCDINWGHDLSCCLKCIGRRAHGLKLLSKPVIVLPHLCLTEADKAEAHSIEINFNDLDDLKSINVAHFDLGYGVMSSIVSLTRDPDLDIQKYRQYITRLCYSSLSIYQTFNNYLDGYDFDRVYVYNGRYAPMRAVLRACQGKKVDCVTHEKGSTLHRFATWHNTTVHDLENTARLIREAWDAADENPEREAIASQFYQDSLQGISRTWKAYTKDQQKDLLPDDWDERKDNIAIFPSSEDEFASIGDQWRMPLYPTQYHGIVALVDSTKEKENIHYYLRIHPNLQGVDNSQTRSLLSINAGNVTIIAADSPVSTYMLLQKASKVITFGSTVGIEAVFWGVPSILLGQCFYKNLGATYNPESHEEAVTLITSKLTPKEKLPALIYGYYNQTYGEEFKYYQPKGIYEGLFKGVHVRPGMFFGLLSQLIRWSWLIRLPRLLRWFSFRSNLQKMGISFEKLLCSK